MRNLSPTHWEEEKEEEEENGRRMRNMHSRCAAPAHPHHFLGWPGHQRRFQRLPTLRALTPTLWLMSSISNFTFPMSLSKAALLTFASCPAASHALPTELVNVDGVGLQIRLAHPAEYRQTSQPLLTASDQLASAAY
ncbi:unnamed protein product [Prorocentrum cordatum]|uniref:Uncharacterized protein n=1 Tax=Prorocentrum cordatum TaxID=2364126 RepID=A0ABN9QVM5_9DINO|nr:unnamed protein product [Polarella glacialis]